MRILTTVFFIVLAISTTQAGAARLDATIPGTNFSVPATVGRFNYSLPPGSVVRMVGLGSPLYSFLPAPANFTLCFEFPPPTFGVCAAFTPADTQFFLGSILLTDPPPTVFPLSGSLPLTVRCLAGPCPTSYTRIGGAANWILGIDYDYQPPTVVPTLQQWALWLLGLLLFLASVVVLRSRRNT
jgi:hypothetical protein